MEGDTSPSVKNADAEVPLVQMQGDQLMNTEAQVDVFGVVDTSHTPQRRPKRAIAVPFVDAQAQINRPPDQEQAQASEEPEERVQPSSSPLSLHYSADPECSPAPSQGGDNKTSAVPMDYCSPWPKTGSQDFTQSSSQTGSPRDTSGPDRSAPIQSSSKACAAGTAPDQSAYTSTMTDWFKLLHASHRRSHSPGTFEGSQWQPEHASQTPAAAEDRALYWAQSRLARRHDARQRQREGLNHVPSDAIIPARPWGSDLPTDLAVAAAQSWDPHSTQPALKASSDRSSRGLGSMGSFTEIYDAHLYPRHHEYHVGSLGT